MPVLSLREGDIDTADDDDDDVFAPDSDAVDMIHPSGPLKNRSQSLGALREGLPTDCKVLGRVVSLANARGGYLFLVLDLTM